MNRGPIPRAFTLIELMVVVTIIVVLLALLAPALDRAVEAAQREVCGANMRGIYQGSYGYAMRNKKKLVPCRNYNGPPKIQIAFEDDYATALADAGLMGSYKSVVAKYSTDSLTTYPPSPVWNCPARAYKSRWGSTAKGSTYEDATAALGWQLVIGYQHFGGIATWTNLQYTGGIKSRSPIDITKAASGWVLATDATAKIAGAWGGAPTDDYADMPSHKGGENGRPSGEPGLHGRVGCVGRIQPDDLHLKLDRRAGPQVLLVSVGPGVRSGEPAAGGPGTLRGSRT